MQRSTLKALAAATLAAGLLSGCVEPISMTIATTLVSYTFDGFSYATEGKSLGDIAISQASDQDCALVRIVKDEPICRDYTLEERRDMAVALVEADRYDRRASRVSDPDLYMPLKSPRPTLVAEAEVAQAKLDEVQRKTSSPVETAAVTAPTVKPGKQTKAAAHRAPHAGTFLAANASPAAPMPAKEQRAPVPADQVQSPAATLAPAAALAPASEAVSEPQDPSPKVVLTNGAPAFGAPAFSTPAFGDPAFGDPEKQFWMPL